MTYGQHCRDDFLGVGDKKCSYGHVSGFGGYGVVTA